MSWIYLTRPRRLLLCSSGRVPALLPIFQPGVGKIGDQTLRCTRKAYWAQPTKAGDRERWVDIRALDILAPILSARLDLAVQKGFDGVDPDNVDGYLNPTGFALAPAHQLQFNRWLAQEAHRRGLAVSLKNDPEQAAALEPYFDFAVSESCFAEGWCDLWQPFTKAGKPVLAIEYTDAFTETEFLQQVCSAVPAGLHAVLHRRKLEGWGVWCGAGIAVPGVAKDLVSQPNHQSADDRPLAS
jgi:hypothetical protein